MTGMEEEGSREGKREGKEGQKRIEEILFQK